MHTIIFYLAPSATCVNAVEVPIQDSSVPIPQDSHFPDLDDWGPHTPIRPLILEWELRDHHDKTFVELDLKNAFRLIPVRQADWNLLGICWQGKYYIDTCLPFGLRSAPYIFNRLATAIHWILQNNYNVLFILHYLDDFLTAGSPHSLICQQNLESMLTLCQRINAPVKDEKVVPPLPSLHF